MEDFDLSANPPASRSAPRRVALEISEKELGRPEFSGRPPRTGTDRAPDAVFVPTPHDVVAEMLRVSGVTQESVLVDLRSGDGRIVIAAAKTRGCKAIGHEIDKRLVEMSRKAVAKEKLEALARIEHADIFTRDARSNWRGPAAPGRLCQ